jgi:5'-3' exonuclease
VALDRAKDIAYMILSGDKSDNLNKSDLETLFADPYFSSQVEVKKTNSGLLVEAHHLLKREYMTTGTHKNHDNIYDGFHRRFLGNLKKLLSLFDVTKEMTQR